MAFHEEDYTFFSLGLLLLVHSNLSSIKCHGATVRTAAIVLSEHKVSAILLRKVIQYLLENQIPCVATEMVIID